MRLGVGMSYGLVIVGQAHALPQNVNDCLCILPMIARTRAYVLDVTTSSSSDSRQINNVVKLRRVTCIEGCRERMIFRITVGPCVNKGRLARQLRHIARHVIEEGSLVTVGDCH